MFVHLGKHCFENIMFPVNVCPPGWDKTRKRNDGMAERNGKAERNGDKTIEIINNTRGGIVIFFTDNKRERVYWGANSSPGCRARRLLAELMLP